MKQISYDIISQLLRKESFPREIARELKTNPMSILRSLRQLAKENIVEYRQIGKSKVFSLKKTPEAFAYACMAEHHRRLKTFEKYPEISILTESILKASKSGLIILFGSYAKLNAKKGSDIDVYIDTTNKEECKKIEQIHSGLSVKIGLFEREDLLMREIIKNHVILRGVESYFEKLKVFDGSQE
jgi:predicted nucleotidyltransferase